MAQRARGSRSGADRRTGRDRAYADARTSEPRGLSGAELAALRQRVRTVVEPVVGAADLDLEELAVVRAGRRFVVRITVDGESGVGHNELSDVSREISAALDQAEQSGGDFAADAYTLEVSSPGVDRPLVLPRHWRRNVGRLVKVTAGTKTIAGRVLEVDDAGVRFDGIAEPVAFDQLGPGRVQVEFTRLAELSDDEIGEEFDDEDFDDNGADTEQEDRA